MKKILCILFALLVLSGCSRRDTLPTETSGESPTEQSPETTTVTTAVTAEVPSEAPTEAPTEPKEERFILTFAGDCTLGCAENMHTYGSAYVMMIGDDYGYPFRNVIDYFENDDFSMVNLEGPLSDSGKATVKKHTFRGPTRFVNILTQNSVEAVTVANNHSMDYGQEGYDSTVSTLENAGVAFVEQDNSMIYTTPSGLTIGVYAVSYDHLDTEEICAGITALDENEAVDLVILAAHWGIENTFKPNEVQIELGHAAIDAGADIVFGTHPHVLQPIEEYNGGIIYYSLGNFTFGGNGNPRDYDTAFVQQEVIRDPDGTVRLGELTMVPCCISTLFYMNDFQPTPYEPGTDGYNRIISKLDGSYAGGNLPWD